MGHLPAFSVQPATCSKVVDPASSRVGVGKIQDGKNKERKGEEGEEEGEERGHSPDQQVEAGRLNLALTADEAHLTHTYTHTLFGSEWVLKGTRTFIWRCLLTKSSALSH